mgnify:CR=1 FL=1
MTWDSRKEALLRVFEEWLRTGKDADGYHCSRVFVQRLADNKKWPILELGPYEE